MIPENSLEKALATPLTALKYQLSVDLARILAGKSYIETDSWAFDIGDFERHGQCKLSIKRDPHPLTGWGWSGSAGEEELEMGLTEVEWGSERIDVLKISWPTSCGTEARSWVIARDQATARAFFDAVCGFCVEPHREIFVFEEGYWEKSEELFESIQGTSLDNLVLAPGLKEEVRRDAESFFSSEERYKTYDIPWKRGLLFTGPPGNGKTHMIKGLVNSLDRSCLYVRSFACEGVSDQRNIRSVFRKARSTAPCLLILEDLDSLITDENRAFFLNELDGFAQNHGILVVATTNHPERLDPAIVERPSRFDRKYAFELPASAERLAFLSLWSGRLRPELKPSPSALARAAKRTKGFSFAYLKELTLSATMRWAEAMRPDSMDAVLDDAVELLRKQISHGKG